MYHYLFFILINFMSFELCGASGTVSVKFVHFRNPKGQIHTGRCCDSFAYNSWICGADYCDNFFIVCLDELAGSPKTTDRCKIGKYETSDESKNEFSFGDFIAGSTPNPKELQFRTWPTQVYLKIEVRDEDFIGDELVDFLSAEVRMPASGSRTDKKWKDFRLKHRIQLHVKLAVFCDENWYGPNCDLKCVASLYCSCKSDGQKDCACPPGKWGGNCTENCNCKNLEKCNATNGRCPGNECAPGWNGTACNEECSKEKWGGNCIGTCYCNKGVRCNATTGECPNGDCAPGWKGTTCDEVCTEIGKWGSNCRETCHCKNGVGCNVTTGRCPNDECAPGWLRTTCNDRCGLPYYQSCDLKHGAPEQVDIIGNPIVVTSAACFHLCEKKMECIALDIIHQNNGSYKCVLMKNKGKSTCLTDLKVKHYVPDRNNLPKTCFINGTLPDGCQGEYNFVGILCDDEPIYEQKLGQHIIYRVRGEKWACTSVDSDMSKCNAPEKAGLQEDREIMAGDWGSDSYAICY